jgi:hypothetical protein
MFKIYATLLSANMSCKVFFTFTFALKKSWFVFLESLNYITVVIPQALRISLTESLLFEGNSSDDALALQSQS